MPPAGWYPDPEQPSGLRYWGGKAWTDYRSTSPGPSRTDNVHNHPQGSTTAIAAGPPLISYLPPHSPAEGSQAQTSTPNVTALVIAGASTFAILLLVLVLMVAGNGGRPSPEEHADYTRELYPHLENASDSEIRDMGREVCALLDEGNSPEDIVFIMEEGARSKAFEFIDASIETYCPEHED